MANLDGQPGAMVSLPLDIDLTPALLGPWYKYDRVVITWYVGEINFLRFTECFLILLRGLRNLSLIRVVLKYEI